jgi:hypothetical protein
VARTRGAGSGILLVLLGAWGALIPFIGPYFNLSYTPDKAWTWSAARGWLEVLPGAATFVGGVLLLFSASRVVTLVGSWLAVAGGAWFVIGPQLQTTWNIGSPGQPAGTSDAIHVAETLVMFSALGAVILFVASAAFGRLSVISPRDVRAAERRQAVAIEAAEAQEAERREVAARESAARQAAARDAAGREAAQRDAAGREAAQRDAAGREAAQRETAPPDTAASDESEAGRHGFGPPRTGEYSTPSRYSSTPPADPNAR